MTTRIVDAKPEQAISTAEKVLKLADPNDTRFNHRNDGFDAVRHSVTWVIFAFIDEYFLWTVTAMPEGQRTSLRVNASRTSASTTAAMVAPGVAAPLMTGAAPGHAIQDPKLYALFWSRFDSLQGKGKWTTCDEFGAPNTGSTALALCGIGREDFKP
ncbi:hypothetical protein [Hydrogenophaga sp. BPS33]|uniref:hypothetical protein n=1 Tax=Hydrogenophaga sp. BPS33 TaxID=2651974 RepID=UPI00131FEFD4|nr:hypothetical protein [Hydrogenophaga sp. BPS33]QHE86505.1 hypothetical protein F9K07_17160 [Hydrogenophaga sp. BPS33]